MIPNVLSIAGSDPSGGAGIQADIKAISANGAFAMTAITALTVQNTQGVTGIHLIPAEFVQDQITTIFDDIRVDAVKIGMIASAETAAAVAHALEKYTDLPVVLDPVMIAKGGAALLQKNAIDTLRDRLLPLATLLTPNLPEAAHLLDTETAKTRNEMATQGAALCLLGAKAVPNSKHPWHRLHAVIGIGSAVGERKNPHDGHSNCQILCRASHCKRRQIIGGEWPRPHPPFRRPLLQMKMRTS